MRRCSLPPLTEVAANEQELDKFIKMLYGERSLSDKEKKKLAKLDKFKEKMAKVEAQQQEVTMRSASL